MSPQKALRVTDPAHAEFTRAQYRLAIDTGKRVTASVLITGLSILGSRHYPELTEIVTALIDGADIES